MYDPRVRPRLSTNFDADACATDLVAVVVVVLAAAAAAAAALFAVHTSPTGLVAGTSPMSLDVDVLSTDPGLGLPPCAT